MKNTQLKIVCTGTSNPLPLRKHQSLLSFLAPIKSANFPSPFFDNSPSKFFFFFFFFVNSSRRVRFFSKSLKNYSFSSLTQSYLLKVTKFLVKIFQIEFSAMIEKNVFLCKIFLSLNFSDFSLFLCKNCNTVKKVMPSSAAAPSRI